MLMIRLQRVGRRHHPAFRVVLTDRRNSPKSGRFLEILGSYDAKLGQKNIKTERIQYWVGRGARTSSTVSRFLKSADKV